jgi:SAM-dependent methyltransferase
MQSQGLMPLNVESLTAALRARPEFKAKIKSLLDSIGYDTTDWVRVVMYQRCFDFIRSLRPETLSALEISGGNQWRRQFAFKSFDVTSYPGFDICAEALPNTYDLIIADQVFEHLKWPARAARNVYQMLEPGGHFIIATPFLVRFHASPIDCSRWTEQGLSCLLQEAGFPEDHIKTDAWGNRACLKANLTHWRKRGFGSLRNEPNYPVMVWAFAQKSLSK